MRGPPVRSPTPQDLEFAEHARSVRSETGLDQSLEALKAICERAAPILGQVVTDVRQGNWFFQADQNPLRSYYICGPASDALGHMLASAGFECVRFRATQLGDNYPSPDHQYLGVKIGDEMAIVDPSHHQMLKALGSPAAGLPDILVMPLKDLPKHLDALSDLRELNPDATLEVRKLSMNGISKVPLTLRGDELREYYARVWTPEPPLFTAGKQDEYRQNLDKFRSGEHSGIHWEQLGYLKQLQSRGAI